MLSIMTARRGITTVPASDAVTIAKALRGVVAIPLHDADPATIAFAWLKDSPSAWIDALVADARALGDGRSSPARVGSGVS
jgi:hypothetical protein